MFSGLNVTEIVMLFLALLISVILHELMHGQVAYWLGDKTAAEQGRLTVNPLASVDPLTTILLPLVMIVTIGVPFFAAKPVPFNPERLRWDEYGMALVGVAGPATNFVLALVAGLVYRVSGGAVQDFAYLFAAVNIGMMIFNLIPFPPLDGSRVLYAFAPEPLQELMNRIEALGFISILIVVFIVFQFISPVIIHLQQNILQLLLAGPV